MCKDYVLCESWLALAAWNKSVAIPAFLPHILMSKIQKEKKRRNKRRAQVKNAAKRQRLPNQQQAKQHYTPLVKPIRVLKAE